MKSLLDHRIAMNLPELTFYLLHAAIIGVSMILGLRCIFAHEHRVEAWRSVVKRYTYIRPRSFKLLTFSVGWLMFLVFLVSSYLQVIRWAGILS
jgi:hypothetical protein